MADRKLLDSVVERVNEIIDEIWRTRGTRFEIVEVQTWEGGFFYSVEDGEILSDTDIQFLLDACILENLNAYGNPEWIPEYKVPEISLDIEGDTVTIELEYEEVLSAGPVPITERIVLRKIDQECE